jgi:hypothetical protein
VVVIDAIKRKENLMNKFIDLGLATEMTKGSFFATVHSDGSQKKMDSGSNQLYAARISGPNQSKTPVDE